MLTDALRRAQRAVELDSAELNLPAAIAAYDDAIALLQLVVERRSKRPGCEDEVERVKGIVSVLASLLFLLPPTVSFFCLVTLIVDSFGLLFVSTIDMSSVYASSAVSTV